MAQNVTMPVKSRGKSRSRSFFVPSASVGLEAGRSREGASIRIFGGLGCPRLTGRSVGERNERHRERRRRSRAEGAARVKSARAQSRCAHLAADSPEFTAWQVHF